MIDVFISYSSIDVKAVTRLAHAVEGEGYEVWWDADIPPHVAYGEEITARIGMAKAVLVVWSKAAAASEWVRAEADMARHQKKLVQAALDGTMPPLPFNQIQFAEIGGWRGAPGNPEWAKIKASLAELCGPRDAATLPPPIDPSKTGPRRWLPYAGAGIGAAALALTAIIAPRGGEPATTTKVAGEAAAVPEGQQSVAVPNEALQAANDAGLEPDVSTAPLPMPSEALQAANDAGPTPHMPTAPAPVPKGAAVQQVTRTTRTTTVTRDGKNRVVQIVNQSSQSIYYVYANPVTSNQWEEDILGSGRVVASGNSVETNLDNGTNECFYDLKIVMADGREHTRRNVNVCAVSNWTIDDATDTIN